MIALIPMPISRAAAIATSAFSTLKLRYPGPSRLGLVGAHAVQVELRQAEHADIARPQACLGMLDANGHQARPSTLPQHTVNLIGAQIHHGGLCLVKDPEFALKIILEGRAPIGEMWSRPMLRKHATSNGRFSTRWYLSAWLRDLHDHGLATGRGAVGDMAPTLGGLGRGVGARSTRYHRRYSPSRSCRRTRPPP